MFVCVCVSCESVLLLLCADVVKMLEEEKKQLDDWEARMIFTDDIRATRQVRGGSMGEEGIFRGWRRRVVWGGQNE